MFKIESNVDNVVARVDKMDDAVRKNLERASTGLKDQLVDRVRTRAPVRTGRYKASITGKVVSGPTGVNSEVSVDPGSSGSAGSRKKYYALWVEYGAKIPVHSIAARNASALSFIWHGKRIVAQKVTWKNSAVVKGQEVVHGAFKEMRRQIIRTLKTAVDEAL